MSSEANGLFFFIMFTDSNENTCIGKRVEEKHSTHGALEKEGCNSSAMLNNSIEKSCRSEWMQTDVSTSSHCNMSFSRQDALHDIIFHNHGREGGFCSRTIPARESTESLSWNKCVSGDAHSPREVLLDYSCKRNSHPSCNNEWSSHSTNDRLFSRNDVLDEVRAETCRTRDFVELRNLSDTWNKIEASDNVTPFTWCSRWEGLSFCLFDQPICYNEATADGPFRKFLLRPERKSWLR